MRVVVDYTPAIQQRGGMGRYANELTRALVEQVNGDEITLFYADALGRLPAPPLDSVPRRVLRWSSKPWRLRVLISSYARLAMDGVVGPGDVFHATDHLLPPLRKMPAVFTLHDVSYLTRPETHLGSNRWFLKLMVPAFLRRAAAVICVSQHTRDDVVRFYGLSGDKLHVIPEGVESRFRRVTDEGTLAGLRKRYGLPERFILALGTIEPRKNLTLLLHAYMRLRANGKTEHRLVVAGRKGWKADSFFTALEQFPRRKDIVLTGPVREEDLPALYSAADLFVYPSLYEGFGLPPLEAMACGTPVIVSSAASLPEVVGDAGLLVDPTSDEELAAAMGKVLAETSLRQALSLRGAARARLFSWTDAARRTREVYEQVCLLSKGEGSFV